MPPVGFEPTISADEWPQNQVLDRSATVICHENIYRPENKEAVVSARMLFRYRQLLAKFQQCCEEYLELFLVFYIFMYLNSTIFCGTHKDVSCNADWETLCRIFQAVFFFFFVLVVHSLHIYYVWCIRTYATES
jgi:hypothetical protein